MYCGGLFFTMLKHDYAQTYSPGGLNNECCRKPPIMENIKVIC